VLWSRNLLIGTRIAVLKNTIIYAENLEDSLSRIMRSVNLLLERSIA
jgi:hypothetical protein